MSWTTVCDLPFLVYTNDTAVDTSTFHNDAVLEGGIQGVSKYVRFQNPDNQLVIPVRNDSLQRFTAIRVQALIHPTQLLHRLNIVEGWMSFSFNIASDGSLVASIFDNQNWVQVTSGGVHVPIGQWSGVLFEYDGISFGRLILNGAVVGTNIKMPMGMNQPREQIAVGHWPNGDGRYTFIGDIGHLRIERRDYEDFARDATTLLFCRRTLTPSQAAAMHEYLALADTINAQVRQEIEECAKLHVQRLLDILYRLRGDNKRNIALFRELADALRRAWCCKFNPVLMKKTLAKLVSSQAGTPGSPEREKFKQLLHDYFAASVMCERSGPPFDRMRELMSIVFPELHLIHNYLCELTVDL